LGAATGNPELALLAPEVSAGANRGIDALGNKYGFGIRRHVGRPRKASGEALKHKRGRPRKHHGGALFPA